MTLNKFWLCCHSDEEMEEANPIEANDSDYDPNKETKKEVRAEQHPWRNVNCCVHCSVQCNMMFKSFTEEVLRFPYRSQSICIPALFVCSTFN